MNLKILANTLKILLPDFLPDKYTLFARAVKISSSSKYKRYKKRESLSPPSVREYLS